jgi:hypothetical protein
MSGLPSTDMNPCSSAEWGISCLERAGRPSSMFIWTPAQAYAGTGAYYNALSRAQKDGIHVPDPLFYPELPQGVGLTEKIDPEKLTATLFLLSKATCIAGTMLSAPAGTWVRDPGVLIIGNQFDFEHGGLENLAPKSIDFRIDQLQGRPAGRLYTEDFLRFVRSGRQKFPDLSAKTVMLGIGPDAVFGFAPDEEEGNGLPRLFIQDSEKYQPGHSEFFFGHEFTRAMQAYLVAAMEARFPEKRPFAYVNLTEAVMAGVAEYFLDRGRNPGDC